MKKIFYILIAISLLVQAEIPFYESKGLYEATKEEYKQYSPLWGFVAVYGGLLPAIRFNGNFDSDDESKDSIAGLIKGLFPSPDGVNFVANNDTGFVGQLSKNIPAINAIFEVLIKNQNINIDKKSIADAIKNKFISINEDGKVAIEILKQNIDEIKSIKETISREDKIKTRNKIKDLFNDNDDKKCVRQVMSEYEKSKNEDLDERFLIKSLKKIKLCKQFVNFDQDLSNQIGIFSQSLSDAFNAQKDLANPEYKDQQLYPKNIVPIVLLSFIVKTASSKDELKLLTSLLNPNILENDDFYTIDDYKSWRGDFKSTLSKESIKNFNEASLEEQFLRVMGYEFYEKAFPQSINYTGNVFCSHLKLNTFPDCGETSLRNLFSLLLPNKDKKIDINFLIILAEKLNINKHEIELFLNDDENIGISQYIDNKKAYNFAKPKNPFIRLLYYLKIYPNVPPSPTKDAHDDWAQVVSGLNDPDLVNLNLNDIQYGRLDEKGYLSLEKRDKGKPCFCEIKSDFSDIGVVGIINMLNVIAKLLPDQTLSKAFSEDEKKRLTQAQEKLDRLTKLLSSEERRIDWVNDSHEKILETPFSDIVFLIGTKDVYLWQISIGHFDFKNLYNIAGWINQKNINLNNENDWVSSLIPKSGSIAFIYKNAPFPEAIDKVLGFKQQAFYPLLDNWLNKLPYDDLFMFERISYILIKYFPMDKVKEWLNLDVFSTQKDNLLIRTSKDNNIEMIEFLLDNGANINSQDETGGSAIHYATLINYYSEKVNLLINRGADINIQNKKGITPLMNAVNLGNIELIKLLLKQPKINIDIKNKLGETVLDIAIEDTASPSDLE